MTQDTNQESSRAENYGEPWTPSDILDNDRIGVVDVEGCIVIGGQPVPRQPYVQRAVACVNACAGISTEDLEFFGNGGLARALGLERNP